MSFINLNLAWGGDWQLDAGGNLQLITGVNRLQQFIIRRLLTRPQQNPVSGLKATPDYLFEPGYGIGAGTLVDLPGTTQFKSSLIQAMLEGIKSEPGVALTPAPQVALSLAANGYLQVTATFNNQEGVQTTLGLQTTVKGGVAQ